jgi:hypothetical protein
MPIGEDNERSQELVKLRGVRIELEEIETALLNTASALLSDAAVVLRGESVRSLMIAGFMNEGRESAERSERRYSAEFWGLCPSGKLDRRALGSIPLGDIAGAEVSASLTATEQQLSD